MTGLASNKLFKQLPAAEVNRLIEVARVIRFAAGQDIFKAGESGDGVYVVKAGQIQISAEVGAGERRSISTVPPGEAFGEMSLLDNLPRSAFATALSDAELIFIPREHLLEVLHRSPELALRLVQEISQRLREFNHQYVREVVQAERLAVVGRFASTIVHDLKNPLGVISLSAEMMAGENATPDERQRSRKRIQGQVEKITSMVNDILDFTRGGQSTQTFAMIDYGEYLHLVIEEMQGDLAARNVQLELANPPPAVKLSLNPKRLNRVFLNLFGNAVDAMPNGGAIRLRFECADAHLLTEVADTGAGIAPEIADHMFEAFTTFGKPKGTGLGLAIVQKIVEEHGGKITAHNQPGGGAVFAFTLPLPQ